MTGGERNARAKRAANCHASAFGKHHRADDNGDVEKSADNGCDETSASPQPREFLVVLGLVDPEPTPALVCARLLISRWSFPLAPSSHRDKQGRPPAERKDEAYDEKPSLNWHFISVKDPRIGKILPSSSPLITAIAISQGVLISESVTSS